jgi:cellulose synthase operon protein C
MMRNLALMAALGGALAWSLAAGTNRAQSQDKPAEAKSSPAAMQIYQDAASAQNGGSFEIAEEGWRKLLKEHPQDPLAAKGQHYLGVCLVQLKKPEEAAAAFQAVLKNHPKFEFLEDTLLNLASSQYSQAAAGKAEQYAAAAETFAALLKQFPKGKYVEDSLYFQGEANYAQGKKAEAIVSYDQLVKEHPKSARRADALYALGVAQEELSKFPEAGATYDVLLKEFPTSPLASEVKMRKAETVLQAGDLAAAAAMFAEVAAVKDFASADHAIYRQAFCLAKQDKFAEAGDLYAKVATDFPQSAYVPEATIAAGRCYYKSDKVAEADSWLAKAIDRKDANSAEAAHWRSRILLRTGKPAEAAALAAAQLAAGGNSPYLVHLKMDQADGLYEIPEKRAESLALYAKIAADHPQHEVAPQALYNAAFAALELKDFDGALKQSASFLAAYPQDKLAPDVKYVAAEANLQQKKYPEAEKLYAEIAAVADHPQSDIWRVRRGVVAYVQKKYPETIAALSPVLSSLKSPDAVAEANFLVGASLFFTDKFADAEKSLTASLAANPKWRQADEALLLLGRSQLKLDQKDAAKASFQKVATDFAAGTQAEQAHFRLGELAAAAADYKTAIAEYETVATKWADSAFAPFALYGKGWAQIKTKEYGPGSESFTALLTKFPEHQLKAESLFGRAMCRRLAGDPKGAVADISEYLKTNPEQARKSDALYEQGLAQVALNDNVAAAKSFADLLAGDPKYAATDKVLYELGWALKSQEKHAEAVPHFAKLAAEFGDSPLAAEAWFLVGENHYDKKEFAEAAKAYAASRATSPSGELAEKGAYKLGWSHYQRKQYDEALKQFSEQLTAFGQGALAADATFMKAECLFRMENYKDAWPAYQAAAKTKASTPVIEVLTLLHGGQSASQNKDWKSAEEMLAAIPAKHPETPLLAEALYELGWARQNAGKRAEALKDFEAAATKSRDHVGARARFMMGELYFTEKKHEEALREFQRAMFGYGGEQAPAETKNWQAKSGYEAGRCAEVQIMSAKDAAAKQKLVADAKRFYSFVAEKHASHELAGEAKKRLEALAKL